VESVSENAGTLSGCKPSVLLSGGLRCATTTGYYLTALQAEERNNAKELLELRQRISLRLY